MDLINVYNALKKGETLPPAPESFEEIIKKDIEKNSKNDLTEKHLEYFTNLLTNNPEPFYAGIHGPNNPIWQKQLKKHHRSMPIFLVRNNTQTYRHKIDKDLVEKVPIDGLCGKTDEENLGFTYAELDRYIREGIIEDEEKKKNID